MRLFQLAKVSIVSAGWVMIMVNARAQQKDSVTGLQSIEQHWMANHSAELTSAKIQVNMLRILDGPAKRISKTHLRAYLGKIKSDWERHNDVKSVVELSKSLPMAEGAFPGSWLSGTIVVREGNVRNTLNPDVVAGAAPDFRDISYLNGVEVFYLKASNQVACFEKKSKWKIFGLADLYCLPPRGEHAVVISENDKTIDLEVSGREFRVDKSNGCVIDANYSHARVAGEMWQCGFAEFRGGDGSKILLPTATASIEYYDDYVTNLFLFIVKSIEYNGVIDDDEFKVGIPQGVTAALYEDESQQVRLGTLRVRQECKDAFELIPALRDRIASRNLADPHSSVKNTGVSAFSKILMLNLAVASIIAVVVWRRRCASKSVSGKGHE